MSCDAAYKILGAGEKQILLLSFTKLRCIVFVFSDVRQLWTDETVN
jgi:hypothetical protein